MQPLSSFSQEINFFINGISFSLSGKNITKITITLNQFLRTNCGFTGTKLGCEEGGCGACSVVLCKYDTLLNKVVFKAINSCITPLLLIDGCHIITIEGIGNHKKMHPIQERFAQIHASQCGFCTPGFVMTLYAAVRNNPQITMSEIETALQGNLCRCTGYRPILDASKTFASDFKCCKEGGGGCDCFPDNISNEENIITSSSHQKLLPHFKPLSDGEELIFPPSLKKYQNQSLFFTNDNVNWYKPLNLTDLLQILDQNQQNVCLIYGTSDFLKFNRSFQNYIDVSAVEELTNISIDENGLHFGPSVPLVAILEFINQLNISDNWKLRFISAFKSQLSKYATPLVRNLSCVGGNIFTSDLSPTLVTSRSLIQVAKWNSDQNSIIYSNVKFEEYITRPRDLSVQSVKFTIPFNQLYEYSFAFKQSITKDRSTGGSITVLLHPPSDPHSSSIDRDDTTDGNIVLDDQEVEDDWKIEDIIISFARFFPIPVIRFRNVENYLQKKRWSQQSFVNSFPQLNEDLNDGDSSTKGDISDVVNGNRQYRRTLIASFLYQFYHQVKDQLREDLLSGSNLKTALPPNSSSSNVSSGIQRYEKPDPIQSPVGESLSHHTANQQVCGEAVYADDIPTPFGCLFSALVKSSIASGKIISVDTSEALAMKGVVGYFDQSDLIIHDTETGREKIFTLDQVQSVGDVIGIVVAESQDIANKAAGLVKVQYDPLPPIITIQDAIEANSYFPYNHQINDGDVDKVFNELIENKKENFIVSGELSIGGQEHFYMEPHAILVVPSDANEIIVHSCTQCVYKTQKVVSQAVGLPNHKIAVKVKRIGGGFGGKETFSMYLAARNSIAAYKLKRPVRILVARDEDMQLSGGRHPFFGRYKAAFNEEGKILAFDVQLYNNAGCTSSTSAEVMDRALCHIHNAYKIENVRCSGYLCRTNITSNTAFRGFGAPQGMLFCETMIENVARSLNLTPEIIRRVNLLKTGDKTPFYQEYNDCLLPRLWDDMMRSSNYSNRLIEIEKFNQVNHWKKRGISLIPTTYGICFPVKYLNQSGALVMVYPDGSVLVSHGGTEMGQGLNIKLIQIAANAFGIPASSVHITETASDKVPNTSPTAASVGSDINGAAVLNACEKIVERLKPLRERMPNASFDQIAAAAYLERISMFSEGFYATPNCSCFDWVKKEGVMYHYFTFGIACSEVEVDILTGAFSVIRSDVMMDVGKTLNAAIDIGQVEGAFVQGFGYWTFEELLYSTTDNNKKYPKGDLMTTGPGSYKIPHIFHVPNDFRVSLVSNVRSSPAVLSSKAVGEPPLFLSATVFFAIKDALFQFRKSHQNDSSFFALDSPATCEFIRMAANDFIVNSFK